MSENIYFSIIFPTNNRAVDVDETLSQIQKSTFKNYEVIIIDNNSTDNTLFIAREFKSLRIIESQNSNLVLDRQKGIDAANNQLVAMIDADHRLRPGDLDSLVKDMHFLERNNF
jgi:glycosyltransferase involved in cell wall biosynthesis